MFDRGSIYLAKLYPSKGSEVGKTIPVLVMQTNMLNHIGHTTVIIVPLTTQCIDNAYPLRFPIHKREQLKQTSDLLCDQLRAIDINRLTPTKIASLTNEEILSVELQIQIVLGFE
ncbi:MAG: mRNA interferase [uncultured Sulfurovum sp.]|uniref:mRNA interferase n=1 Tax=uncultured Sulfurovum sp. TaxID=269237 RepID=A0A6S6SIJ4_9BACT|nr:MAG: mRNA interferase [uncultured Sulfurovum sp.]